MPKDWMFNVEKPLLGEFTLDPSTKEFKDLRSVCEPGNPWRCLIATSGSMHLGRRMSVRLDHVNNWGVIGVTEGDYRFERPMTPAEVAFAAKFDLGEHLHKPLTVRVDLGDDTWKAKPKQVGGGRPVGSRNAKRRVKTIRARQLEAIRKAHADGGAEK
jgi:hypothetical protein